MRAVKALIALGLLFFVCGAAYTSAPSVPVLDTKGLSAYGVTEIVDGDTIKVQIGNTETTVRLIGVDTPETVHPSKPVEEYGKEASSFTRNLLAGESVYLTSDAQSTDTDKYGRKLAYVWRYPDGMFVNLEIVRQGYGHAYTVYPFDHQQLFKTYETRAREIGKGLWATETPTELSSWADRMAADNTKTESPKAPSVDKPKDTTTDVTVYITRTGSKYHRGSCRYLKKSKIPISLKDAKAQGYGP